MSKYTVFIRICMVSVILLILMGCSAGAKTPAEASEEISTGAAAETEADALIDLPTTAKSVNYYLVAEQAEAYPVPCLTLSEGGQFSFTYDVLSSYYPSGTYIIKDKQLTAKTADRKYTYIFTQIDDETFNFKQNGSSDVRLTDKNIGISITDGAEFVKKNAPGSEGTSSMTGLCLVSDDGQYLIVDEQGIPIVMSNQSGSDDLFSSLETWDKIEITYDGIQETYPARTGVYTCRLIEKSSTDVIPENTLSQLQQLGWSFPITCE